MRESRYPEYHTGFNPYAKARGIMHINDTVTPYYVRFQVADQPGVIAEIARILATFGIGISATSSAPSHIDEGGAPGTTSFSSSIPARGASSRRLWRK